MEDADDSVAIFAIRDASEHVAREAQWLQSRKLITG
jgi:hypothetical protein